MNHKKFIRYLLGFANLIFLVFLIIPYIPSDKVHIINLFYPFTPYVLVLGLPVCLISILLKEKKMAITSFALFAFSFIPLSGWISFNKSSEIEIDSFSILSYNASFFRFPVLFQKDYLDTSYDHTIYKSLPWILDQQKDIVCIQEFFHDDYSPIYNSIELIKKAGYAFYFNAKSNPNNGTRRGIITLSKFPILNQGLVTTTNDDKFSYNASIFTDLLINQDTLRLINVHLRSTSYSSDRSGLRKIVDFYRRYVKSSLERSRQINEVKKFINDSDYPVLVVGDFNETPFSYNFRQIAKGLNNAHRSVGNGVGTTFKLGDLLGVRIDHILFTDDLKPISFNVADSIDYSAHYPISGTFGLFAKDE